MHSRTLIHREERDKRLLRPGSTGLSSWSRSRAKRIFDIGAVVVSLPVLAPVLGILALGVFVTSGAPVIFRQKRSGIGSDHFAIFKFRTMQPEPPDTSATTSALSIESADRITWFGSFLRKTKLDELPQVINILAGDMSLVGPRPKVPEQQLVPLTCRPGLTGPATLAFAREEILLMQIPKAGRTAFYYDAVLPAKQKADSEYMRQATLASDLRILLNTALGRWDAYEPNVSFAGRANRYEEASNEANAL